jgi:hypothetical protein
VEVALEAVENLKPKLKESILKEMHKGEKDKSAPGAKFAKGGSLEKIAENVSDNKSPAKPAAAQPAGPPAQANPPVSSRKKTPEPKKKGKK